MPLDKNKVHFVDRIGNNYLFRSDIPIVDGKFAYLELETTAKQILKEKALLTENSTEQVYFYDFCLLNHIEHGESSQIEIERNFFENHPENGTFVPAFTIFPFPWKMERYIRKARDILENAHASPPNLITVVFFHCEAGRDRTGAYIGAYRMKYLGQSYNQVQKENEQEAGHPNYWLTLALKMYALTLKIKGFKTVEKI